MTVFEPLSHQKAGPLASGHRFDGERRWAASIELGFTRRDEPAGPVTRLTRARHQGPLRVQRPFYPEPRDAGGEAGGEAGSCHVYLLHPPGGLVSGDALSVGVQVGEGARALVTTPAANKLYRADSHGVAWTQHTSLSVKDGGELEWLPQETIAFDGSRGVQSTEIALEREACCLGWEVLALGRPAGELPFVSGHLEQRFSLTRDGLPLWHERQLLDPTHPRFSGRWGQGGASVQATLWAVGLEDESAAVEVLREVVPSSPRWAVTVRQGVFLLRYLGDERNEAWTICQAAWAQLRPLLLGREACVPRIWMT